MFKLNSFLKFLERNKLYTIINVGGLALSLSVVILIASYAIGVFSFDKFHENRDNIYLLANEKNRQNAHGIGEKVAERFAGIERVTELTYALTGPITYDDKSFEGKIMATDSNFFKIFSFDLLQGDRENLFVAKDDALLSKSFAQKLFGEVDPMGKQITHSGHKYIVVGVYDDIEYSCIPPYDMLISMQCMDRYNNVLSKHHNNATGVSTFIEITPESDILSKCNEIADFYREFFWIYKRDIYKDVTLTPLTDVFLSELQSYFTNYGSRSLTMIMILAGVVILLLSLFNYINLTIAQSGYRAKEFATHRLLGASPAMTFARMIIESTILSCVAFALGVLGAIALEPHLNEMLNSYVSVLELVTWEVAAYYLISILIIGVVTGIIPAMVMQRFKPIDVIKGEFTYQTKMRLSRVFITLQSVISISFIGFSLVANNQVSYLINADLGFNKDNIISIQNTFDGSSNLVKLCERLKQLPFVESVGYTQGTPANGGENSTTQVDVDGVETTISFQMLVMDSAAMNIFGIEVLRDNGGRAEDVFLNERALEMIGADMDSREYKLTDRKKSTPIRGVVRNFMIRDFLSSNIPPLRFFLNEDIEYPWHVVAKISDSADREDSFSQIQDLYSDVMGYKSDYIVRWVDDEITNRSYIIYKVTSDIMLIATIIAILISSMGLFAISTYYIGQRSKEIALRKIVGASNSQIMWRFIMQFMRLVAVAAVISCPIIWYASSRWLEQFVNRIDLALWHFIVAISIIALVSLLTLYFQCRAAASRNPIDAIKR